MPIDLTVVAKNAKSVHSFIDDGTLFQVLETLGDVEYEAAKEAFEKVKRAKDKRAQLWSVVTHLETAHKAFEKAWRSPYRKYFKMVSFMETVEKDQITLALMAVCYRYLGEEKLVLDTCEKVIEAWEKSNYSNMVEAGFAILTANFDPKAWMEAVKEEFQEKPIKFDMWDFYQGMTGKRHRLLRKYD
jgi:hypothetical protein